MSDHRHHDEQHHEVADRGGLAAAGAGRLSDEAVEMVACRLRVFGDPMRIRLLEALDGAEAGVQQLADLLDTTRQNVSKHLGVLFQAGVVSRRRDGGAVRYALIDWTGWWLVGQISASLADQLEDRRAALDPSGGSGK